jgi:hypothetical protein
MTMATRAFSSDRMVASIGSPMSTSNNGHPETGPHFADDYHALTCGEVLGALMACGMDALAMADDDGNYVPSLQLSNHGRVYVVTVRPYEDAVREGA